MTSREEGFEEPEDKKIYLMSGIYRVVKSIEDRVETLLDELREAIESRNGDYFLNDQWDHYDPNGYC